MAWRPRDGEVDQDIFDALAEFAGHLVRREELLAHQFGVPRSCIKAIRRLDTSVTMKELAERLHCDPSFVTKIADALEQRRLARREPNATDRRIKNLVLTPQGVEMKERLEQAMLAQMPWSYTLDVTERERLLAVIRTLNGAPAELPN
jgi:MarR family transcriptional regulator, organic hydroperoxide resistance regulator